MMQRFIRIVEERDTSSGCSRLVVTLYDKTVAMEKLVAMIAHWYHARKKSASK